MAAGHRPRKRYRDVLAYPPGPQHRGFSVFQPGQPQRKGRDRGQSSARLSSAKLDLAYLDVNALSTLDRQFLVERQLISRELSSSDGPRGVAISPLENSPSWSTRKTTSASRSCSRAFALHDVWEAVNSLDDQLEEHLAFAFSPQLGYLTACPTNVGTGIRVGVMLHLPGLVQNKQIDKVFRALQKINLAVRGLYGEGSQASGDFYQISNQQTLGKSEPELIKILTDVVPQVLQYERAAAASPLDRAAAASARPGQPCLRSTEDGADDHKRGDHAAAFERAHGDQPGPHRGPLDRHRQRAVHPDPARLPAKAAGKRAGIGRTQRGPRVLPAQPAVERPAAPACARGKQPVSFFSFELDPLHVLGVSAEATLEEIRAAYREKAKRYHPDKGGEDWTFRHSLAGL